MGFPDIFGFDIWDAHPVLEDDPIETVEDVRNDEVPDEENP